MIALSRLFAIIDIHNSIFPLFRLSVKDRTLNCCGLRSKDAFRFDAGGCRASEEGISHACATTQTVS